MRSIECTVTGSALNVSSIQIQVIGLVDLGRMQFFRIITWNLSITLIDTSYLVVIIAPHIIRLKWVNMSCCLKYSILIDILYLESMLCVNIFRQWHWLTALDLLFEYFKSSLLEKCFFLVVYVLN